MTIILQISDNLQNWSDNEAIVGASLRVLRDLTSGYEFSRLLLSLQEVQYILEHSSVGLNCLGNE